MSQDWVSNLYTTSTVADTTLSNMELMFASLFSCLSGTSAPASPVEGTLYRNTTNNSWRGYTGAAWVGIMHGDANQKMWVYRDSAMDGWVVDSSVTDRVLGLKGGSYYTAGAATAGSWDLAHTHTTGDHALTEAEMPSHTHTLNIEIGTNWSTGGTAINEQGTGGTEFTSDSAGSGSAHNHGSTGSGLSTTWRPSAAVGTLQYVDLT